MKVNRDYVYDNVCFSIYEFWKSTPGDLLKYRNALEVPSVFGCDMSVEITWYGFRVCFSHGDLDMVDYYIKKHEVTNKSEFISYYVGGRL